MSWSVPRVRVTSTITSTRTMTSRTRAPSAKTQGCRRFSKRGLLAFGVLAAGGPSGLELLGERRGIVDVPERLDHRRAVNADGAILCVVIDEVARQRLDIAVEDQPHQLAAVVHHRAPRIA